MKLKAIVFGVIAVMALGLSNPARATVATDVVDVYETGLDQLLPFASVTPGYVVMLEAPTTDVYNTDYWSDVAVFFSVFPENAPSLPSPDPGNYVHLYSNTPGPAQTDLSGFLPAVQNTGASFLVEDPSGVTDYIVGGDNGRLRDYKFHEGNLTPEPGTASSALLGLAGLGLVALVRRRA